MPESIVKRVGSFWHPFRMRSAKSFSVRGSPLRSDTPATLCDHFVIKTGNSIGRERLEAPSKSFDTQPPATSTVATPGVAGDWALNKSRTSRHLQ
jgi:hypothetical protein